MIFMIIIPFLSEIASVFHKIARVSDAEYFFVISAYYHRIH